MPQFDPKKNNHAQHANDCRCPECLNWSRELDERRAAEATLARRRERQQTKTLTLKLKLAEKKRRTAEYLRKQSKVAQQVKRDPRLDLLLNSRHQDKPIAETLTDVERRFERMRAG